MTVSHLGESAALATAVCWTVTALVFELSSRRIGSLAVNILRLILAAVLLSFFTGIARGHFFPADASCHQWAWLSLSGLIGFTLGDMALFQAFVVIGARISLLIMSLVPPMAALLSWVFLGETLGWANFAGMCLVVGGIVLVITGRPPLADETRRRHFSLRYSLQGILLALGGAMGQAGGLVMSKYGMGDYHPFAATQIRVYAGIIGFAVLFSFWKKWANVRRGLRDRKALWLLGTGSIFGPFLGVSFSLMAVQHANTGVASTIMSITPVLIIPPAIVFFREKVSFREIAGAVLAVAGVAIFFF